MRRLIKATVVSTLICCMLIVSVSAAGNLPYNGYNYNAYGESTPAPEGYEPVKSFSGMDLDCGAFNNPQDLFVAPNGEIYIADTGNNRIVVVSSEYRLIRTLDTILMDDKQEPLTSPTGLFVTNESVYIAQGQNGRVLRCDLKGKVQTVYSRPVTDVLDKSVEFNPTKVLVNQSGTVYILIQNFVYGALLYSPDGKFLTFYGSNKVEVTLELLVAHFWKQILRQEQVNQMKRYVPAEFTNFDIDSSNFIYTITKSVTNNQVRKLNTLGENVLPMYNRNVADHTGNFGDLEVGVLNRVVTTNNFVDLAVDDQGFINLLDQNNGRIFQYDAESRLLHIFGGNANFGYGFKTASALEVNGDDLVVLDEAKGIIVVLSPTEYGRLVREAVLLYNDGFYTKAKQTWSQVIHRNQNFEMAYNGLGMASFEEGNYKEAMDYFRLAYNREGYSKAYQEYRGAFLRTAFPIIATTVLILCILWLLLRKRVLAGVSIRSKTMAVLFHPSDELAERKYHKLFRTRTVYSVMVFMILSMVFSGRLTGFAFNYSNPKEDNALVTLAIWIFVFVSFCTVNWCITSLLDGKGTFKEIACCVSYSLIPYIGASYVSVALSHFLTIEEGVFLTIISVAGILWSAFLLIASFKTIHDYSFSKTIISTVLTAAGVVFLIFLCMLLLGLLQQIGSFFTTVFHEIMYRRF